MKPLSKRAYNNLDWQVITLSDLQRLLKGSTVLGVRNPTDDTYTVEAELYIKDRYSKKHIVSFSANLIDFLNIKDVVDSHKDIEKHKEYMKIDELDIYSVEAPPMYICEAEITEER
jgi:hypothetical protein